MTEKDIQSVDIPEEVACYAKEIFDNIGREDVSILIYDLLIL